MTFRDIEICDKLCNQLQKLLKLDDDDFALWIENHLRQELKVLQGDGIKPIKII
jgi:hypothetical protein